MRRRATRCVVPQRIRSSWWLMRRVERPEQHVELVGAARESGAGVVAGGRAGDGGDQCESCHLGGREHDGGVLRFRRWTEGAAEGVEVPPVEGGGRSRLVNALCAQCHSTSPRYADGSAARNSTGRWTWRGACGPAIACDCHDPHRRGTDVEVAVAACVGCHGRMDMAGTRASCLIATCRGWSSVGDFCEIGPDRRRVIGDAERRRPMRATCHLEKGIGGRWTSWVKVGAALVLMRAG
jgi:hypothetical protein